MTTTTELRHAYADAALLETPYEDRKALFESGTVAVAVTPRAVFLAGGLWYPLAPRHIVAIFGDGLAGNRFIGEVGGFGWKPATQAQAREAQDGTRGFRTSDEAQPLRGEIGFRAR
jgi:hypothetical protein